MDRPATAPILAALLFVAGLLPAAETIRQIIPPAGQSLAVLQAPVSRGTWAIVADEDLATVEPQLVADGSLAILVAKPGRYHVRWRAGLLKPWQASTVDLGGAVPPGPVPPGPTPQPTPTPTPTPPPAPAPVLVKFVVVVCEASDPADDVDIAAIRLAGVSGEIAEACRAAGVTWRCVDQDVVGPDGKPPKELAPFLAEAKGKKLPWLIGAGPPDAAGDSAIVLSERCPADVAGVLARMKGGAK